MVSHVATHRNVAVRGGHCPTTCCVDARRHATLRGKLTLERSEGDGSPATCCFLQSPSNNGELLPHSNRPFCHSSTATR